MRNEKLAISNGRGLNSGLFLPVLAVIIAMVTPRAAFALDSLDNLKISGEAKTGIFWQQTQTVGSDKEGDVTLHSKDDAGGGQGRYRLNLDYERNMDDKGFVFGMRARINWETFKNTAPDWSYAFGYGNLFNNQLTISLGRLGGSPWGTGGPEMWKELEEGRMGGIRTEWKPAFVPGNLNVGFVLNYFNADRDQGNEDVPVSLLNILEETIIGASYSNDYFLARMAYRLDSEMDATQGVGKQVAGGKGEDELVYRFEEKMLTNLLPGLQVWALGHWFGVASTNDEMKAFKNWLFVQYAPEQFTAQMRIGYDYISSRSDFYVKPSFYYNLFGKLVSVGAYFQYCQDFGEGKVYKDSAYRFIEVEPKIQLNFSSSYVAFAYNFRQEYLNPAAVTNLKPGQDPLKQTHWMNLRFCIYF